MSGEDLTRKRKRAETDPPPADDSSKSLVSGNEQAGNLGPAPFADTEERCGQPAITQASAPSTDRWFAVELVSVTFPTQYILMQNEKDEIEDYEWQAEGDDDGAPQPVAFASGELILACVILSLTRVATEDCELTFRLADGQAPPTLSGELSPFSFQGQLQPSDLPVNIGDEKKAIIGPVASPRQRRFTRTLGKIRWILQSPNEETIEFPATPVDIFDLIDQPCGRFKVNKVWYELLHCLSGKMGANGLDINTLPAKIVESLYGNINIKYQRAAFGSGQGAQRDGDLEPFCLMNYCRSIYGGANIEVLCTDQSAAVQCFLNAVGIDANWAIIDRRFYISTLNLVGIGLCNNPFITRSEELVLDEDEFKNRTAFQEHVCIMIGERVFDATVGPCTGDVTLLQYLEKVIDLTANEQKIYSDDFDEEDENKYSTDIEDYIKSTTRKNFYNWSSS